MKEHLIDYLKCGACGYFYKSVQGKEGVKVVEGDAEFTEHLASGGRVYSCPKCGTLKVPIGIEDPINRNDDIGEE